MSGTLAFFVAAAVAASSDRPTEAVGVLAVAPAPGPTAELVEMTTRLHAELAVRSPGMLTPRELAERMTTSQPTASLPELDRAYAGAVEASRTDPERGMSWLRDIIAELERQVEGPDAFGQWTRAHLRLARLRMEYVRSPDEASLALDDARAILTRVVRADPALKLDPAVYPKRMLELAAEIRKELGASGTVALTVKSNASDTRVFVDGRDVGKAPLKIKVARGTYRVTGIRGAVRTAPMSVSVTEPTEVGLDVLLPEAFRPREGPGLAISPVDEKRVVEAASALGLDRVVTVAHLSRDNAFFLVASVIQVKPLATSLRQGWVRIDADRVPQGGYAAFAEFLVTGRQVPGIRTTDPMLPGGPPALTERPKSSEVKKVPKWTPIAAGALAVGLGVVATLQGASASRSYGEARAMVGPGGALLADSDASQYGRLVAQGDQSRTVATITGVAGGLLAGATAALATFAF